MSSSATTTAASSPSSTDHGNLRPLHVTSTALHAGSKDNNRRQSSSMKNLHQVESISVAVASSSECFQVAVCMKRPGGHTAISTHELSLQATRAPTYHIPKQLADFHALSVALRRAVQVTHLLLSRCVFCKAMKAHCRSNEEKLGCAGAADGPNKTQQLVNAFMSGVFRLVSPLRSSTDERVCYGEVQCRHLLNQYILPRPRQAEPRLLYFQI